jgi:hypothetical protein
MNYSSGDLKRIGTFIVLAFALSLPFYIIIAITGEFALPLLLAPMVAALITRDIYQRNVRDLGWKLMNTGAQPRWWQWGNSRFLALSYAMPLAIGILVYGLTWVLVAGVGKRERISDGWNCQWPDLGAVALPAHLLIARSV